MDRFDERVGRLCRENWTPLAVQRRAAALLEQTGRGIVLLPTGAGKTLLAALPFAAGLLRPKQMVFMTPLRTLTDAQTRTLRDPKEIDSAAATELLGVPWTVRSQTGSAPEDPLFTAAATVCTFDQALSSALSISYSTSRRRRGINAGAILTAYLVCDELHLFPRNEALTTLLWLLKHRPPELPFLLMTATLSRPIAEALGHHLDAEVIDALPPGDVARLGVAARIRRVRWRDEPLDAASIIAAARESPNRRAIVVVNTVKRAQELGAAVAGQLGWEGVRVLHSRFYPDDRQQIERMLQEWMGKEAESKDEPRILIATQVIEAGLDISADALLTEWAPANALVQRWGRSARWGGVARVIVAPPPGDAALPFPYAADKEMGSVLENTRAWLREHAMDGVAMTAERERDFLDAAHWEVDKKWVDGLAGRLAERAPHIGAAIQQGQYHQAGGLIRRVENRTVLLHGNADALTDPWHHAGFSLAANTLRGLLGVFAKRELGSSSEVIEDEEGDFVSFGLPVEMPWLLKYPVWDEAAGERRAATPSRWEVATANDLKREALFLLNPDAASYDERLGLGFEPDTPTLEAYWSPPVTKPDRASYLPYRRETYREHAARMLTVLDGRPALWPTIGAIAPFIELWCAWPAGMLRRLVEAAIILHDAGKLSNPWQDFAQKYQRLGGNPYEPWLVHTDQRPGITLRTPGPHALAGAASSVSLGQALDEEVDAWRMETGSERWDDETLPSRVLFTAIATHHGAEPHRGSLLLGRDELLGERALNEIRSTWGLTVRARSSKVEASKQAGSFNEYLVLTEAIASAGQDAEYLALAVVSRLLRLADGWSQEVMGGGDDDDASAHTYRNDAGGAETDRLPR